MNSLALPLPRALAIPANDDDPRQEIRIGAIAGAVFLTVFVGWAALARLDSAAISPGVVRVSGERKVIQSLSGGVIAELNTSEGAHVRAGQILVRLASSDALAQERSLTHRVIGLWAQIARLEAQRLGDAKIVTPVEFARLNKPDQEDAMRALAAEQRALEAVRTVAHTKAAALDQRIAEIGSQIGGYASRSAALRQQRSLSAEELSGIEQLAAKGYASKNRVLALRRSVVGLDGDSGAMQAEVAGLRHSAGEARMQSLQITSDLAQQTAQELREAQTNLEALLPQWQAARDQLSRSELRAPVSGQVVNLQVHTVGGVATPGQTLMEVVPADRSLTIETEVSVGDANEISVGQQARVQVTGLHSRQTPILHGRIARVSEDSLSDQKSGRSYYTASVQVPQQELDALSKAAGIKAIRPGTPVQVQVSLKARSALSYWLDPLTQIFGRSLHER